jgi:hypothetical protein
LELSAKNWKLEEWDCIVPKMKAERTFQQDRIVKFLDLRKVVKIIETFLKIQILIDKLFQTKFSFQKLMKNSENLNFPHSPNTKNI